jgi:hypothetical protein
MSYPTCLQQPSGSAGDLFFSDGVFDTASALVMCALGLAALAAPWVRRAYRKRVERLMRFEQIAPRPAAWWRSPAIAAASEPGAQAPAAPDAGALMTMVDREERRITRATVAAWLAFSLAAILVAGWIEAGTGLSGRITFAGASALLALGPALTNLPPRWTRWTLGIGFVGCVLGMLLMSSLGEDGGILSGTGTEDDDLPVWQAAAFALAVGGAYLVMFHRSLRGHVMPVFVLLVLAMLSVLFPLGFVQDHSGACLVEGSPYRWALPPLGLALVLVALWLAFAGLGALARVVERGWLSERSMGAVLGLLVIALALVFAQIPDADDGRASWLAWLPLGWTAFPLAVYAAVLGRRPVAPIGPQLLMLRVFARDRHKHTLLDGVQSRWRYVGAVHEIGGPDMVALNIDPYEGTMFLQGRLHDLFLPEAANTAQLEGRLQVAPDREGRYRINEVFCFNTAWRSTVEQLMQLSDAVLLDVRGLTAQREGTGYEIRRLARGALLTRVVAVGDEATDWSHVDGLLRAEGQDPECLRRVQAESDPHGNGLFEQLLETAAARRRASRDWPPTATEPRASVS